MRIRITDQALIKLMTTVDADTTGLKLLYDTEGCGCGLNGIARVVPVPRIHPVQGEVSSADAPYHFFYDISDAIFFEDAMVLDFNPNSDAYHLKSDSQTYYPGFSI